jgi:DNA-binding winged helix-turn-helix (wHTH) protein
VAGSSSGALRVVASLTNTATQGQVYRFGTCELRLGSRELIVDGTVQLVEPLTFDLLVYLIQRRARVVSKHELLDHVWRTRFVSAGVIASAIYRARLATRDSEKPRRIKTMPRIGYRFTGEVEEHTPFAWTAWPGGSAPQPDLMRWDVESALGSPTPR